MKNQKQGQRPGTSSGSLSGAVSGLRDERRLFNSHRRPDMLAIRRHYLLPLVSAILEDAFLLFAVGKDQDTQTVWHTVCDVSFVADVAGINDHTLSVEFPLDEIPLEMSALGRGKQSFTVKLIVDKITLVPADGSQIKVGTASSGVSTRCWAKALLGPALAVANGA